MWEIVFAWPFRQERPQSRQLTDPTYRENALVPRREWQQGDVAGLLNSACESALVRRTHTSQPAGNNLASLGDELLQQAHIAIVNRVDLLHAELADLLAPEELASARTRSARTTGSPATGATTTTGRTIPRGTVWTIPGGALWTITRWTIWTVSRRTVARWTLGRGAFGRARCCCYSAGFLSHGFPSSFFPPVFSRRNRPCCQLLLRKQDRLQWFAGTWPALRSKKD
jgi:hypothetical protein